jgi:helix-turn-helix protein
MPEALRWSPPITRLGARIFDLRAEGHNIIERRPSIGPSFAKSYSLLLRSESIR